jgi:hypothetical protein
MPTTRAKAKPIILTGKTPLPPKPTKKTTAATPKIEAAPEPVVSAVSVKELTTLCEAAREQAQRVEELQAALKPETDRLAELQAKILVHLEQNEMEKFAVKGFGTYFLKSNFSVKVPKLDDDRIAFFGYLKEKGIFEQMITVNSMTLNAWYKQEMDALIERAGKGEDVDPDFKIPGIEEPKPWNTLNFRKETKRG